MLKAVVAVQQQSVAAASRSNRLVSRLHLAAAERVWLTALSVSVRACVCVCVWQ